MWLWRAVAALSAAADSAAARAAAAAGCSPRALKAGLGTALAIVALHRLLSLRRAATRAASDAVASGAAPPGLQSRLPAAALAPSRASSAASPAVPSVAPLALSRVSLATAGILFSGPPDALPEGPPTLAARAASALAVLAAVADVYLITQLAPGDGAAAAEAAARDALAAAGLLGPGAVPAHRALFCTTHVGRIALARQMAADVHVDGCATAVRELSRFGTRLVHVVALPAGTSEAGQEACAPNVQTAAALTDWVSQTWPGL